MTVEQVISVLAVMTQAAKQMTGVLVFLNSGPALLPEFSPVV
jgi:hypothetical protein